VSIEVDSLDIWGVLVLFQVGACLPRAILAVGVWAVNIALMPVQLAMSSASDKVGEGD